jgi:hypothetical protein
MLRKDKEIDFIKRSWGKKSMKSTDSSLNKALFEVLEKSGDLDEKYIDEQTWSDLNMDEIYSMLNHSTSLTGSQVLYLMLRQPLYDKQDLQKRESLIDLMSAETEIRNSIQSKLIRLNGENKNHLLKLFWEELPAKPKNLPLLYFLSVVSILILIAASFQLIPWYVLIVMFAVNTGFYYPVKSKYGAWIDAAGMISGLINAANEIRKLPDSILEEDKQKLEKVLPFARKSAGKFWWPSVGDSFGFTDYLKIYFLIDVLAFYQGLSLLEKHRSELRDLYLIVGKTDALIAVASYRKSCNDWSIPGFPDNNEVHAVNDVIHPSLNEPVANSMVFTSKSLTISGSNMAGKSTFLRSIGINAILAQSINTCHAKLWNLPFVHVMSSMNLSDSINNGKSYYYAEIERMLQLIKTSESENIHLFLVDELLRGTNSEERQVLSAEVLNYLCNGKDFILSATHDLELAKLLGKSFSNHHFQEKLHKDGLIFDFKMKEGIATSRNAISLIESYGYPGIIVKKALERLNQLKYDA